MADLDLIVAALFGGKDNDHVHVDVVSPAASRRRPTPRLRGRLSQIYAILNGLANTKIRAELEAVYFVSPNELPEIARASMVEGSAGNISLSVKGGIIDVTGAPVRRITWLLGNDEDAIMILQATTKLVISESYLQEAFEVVDSAFRSLVPHGG